MQSFKEHSILLVRWGWADDRENARVMSLDEFFLSKVMSNVWRQGFSSSTFCNIPDVMYAFSVTCQTQCDIFSILEAVCILCITLEVLSAALL